MGRERGNGASKGLFIGQVFADFQFADLGVEGGGLEIQQFSRTPFSTDAPLALAHVNDVQACISQSAVLAFVIENIYICKSRTFSLSLRFKR